MRVTLYLNREQPPTLRAELAKGGKEIISLGLWERGVRVEEWRLDGPLIVGSGS